MNCAHPDCSAEFIVNVGRGGKNRKFCSKRCCWQFREKQAYIPPVGATDLRICANPKCSNTFNRLGKGKHAQKYCTRKCKNETRNADQWKRLTEVQKIKYRGTTRRWAVTAHGRYVRLCHGAKTRRLEVTITEQQYTELIKDHVCFYCSEPLGRGTCIDRFDRSIGYTSENCRPCCWRCNELKGHLESCGFSPERCLELLKESIPLVEEAKFLKKVYYKDEPTWPEELSA